MKYTIKAAFLDTIERLQHRRDSLINLTNRKIVIKKDPNEISKEELISIITTYPDYEFQEDYILFTRGLNTDEINKEKKDIEQGIEYDIHRLVKWSNSSKENAEQILSYITRHNIKIKGLN